MDLITPSKEEFEEWMQSNVTQYVRHLIQETQDNVKEFLCNGGTLNKNQPLTTDYVVGRIQGLNDFLLIKYEEVDEKSKQGKNYDH